VLYHLQLGTTSFKRSKALYQLIMSGEVRFAGYVKNKIYGLLSCASGKRMKIENRVFFSNEQEAIAAGYRPCRNCMTANYKSWTLKQPK
jgi:methylphosphotriester-DNA--protein-cysteine methyltransferase